MPIKEINVIAIMQKVFEQTITMMPETTANLANILIDKAHELWHLRANNAPMRKDGSPSKWGERYAGTLRVEYMTSSGGVAKVYADENDPDYMFVEMVENGVRSWSIKDALLSGKAAQRNLGKYGNLFVTVPFRYRIPGKTKETSTFSGIMPQNVYEMAKSGAPVGADMGKFAGLKKYGEGPHTQYRTFRTVSKNAPGWMYPSFPATPVFEETFTQVEKMMEQTIYNFVQAMVKDMEKTAQKEGAE